MLFMLIHLPELVDLHVSLDLVVWVSGFDLVFKENNVGVPEPYIAYFRRHDDDDEVFISKKLTSRNDSYKSQAAIR